MTDVAAARVALLEGLELNSAGRPVEATAAFQNALRHLDREHGEAADDDVAYVRARALLGLAVSELELTGDLAAAERQLKLASRWAAGSGAVAVAIQGQLGLVRMRGGDVTGALAALDAAAGLVGEAEPLDACRILLNRGSLLLELGRLDEAREDLRASAERAADAGDPLRLFKARHNLGYAHFLAGDLPAALAAMAEAAATEHGASPAVALLDRAHVLVDAGLVAEADTLLAEAAEIFAVERMELDLAQVDLARASCALLEGRAELALDRARSARERFASRGNAPWLVRAELAECQAELAMLLDGPDPSQDRLVEVARRAAELAGREGSDGSHLLATEARLTAAEGFAAAGRGEEAGLVLGAADGEALRSRLPLAVRAHHVRARLALASKDREGAQLQVRAGQRLLAEHRSQFGSVEAVAAAAVHGERLTHLNVGVALGTGDAGAVLEAVEQGRATFAGPARVRPPDDAVLSGLLIELRQCIERHRSLPPDGDAAVVVEREQLARRAADVRHRARERAWQLGEGVAPEPGPRTAGLRSVLRSNPGVTVLDLFTHDGEVSAVVVDSSGERLERLCAAEDLVEPLRRLRADLGVLARPLAPEIAVVVQASLERGLRLLDGVLLGPVARAAELHVVASGELATVPWGALPSRRGLATSVATRLRLAGSRSPSPRSVPRALAIAGPGLAHAEREVEAVAAAWPGGRAVTGDAARCGTAVAALGSADVVHLATHGHHETDNPLFSWVRLVDGPLFAHELDGVRVTGTVVLSACEVGRVTSRPGGEALGLASVLLRLGARAVVAALAPLPDELAARVMPVLHEGLARGEAPAAALARVGDVVGVPVPLTCFTAGVPALA